MWYTKQDFADGEPLLPVKFCLPALEVERADMRNFGEIISEKIFKMRQFICACGEIGIHDGFRCCHLSEEFFINQVKAGVACFYGCGSSATLRLGYPLLE